MCIHSSRLEGEWQYARSTGMPKPAEAAASTILLTGATGFLGSHLLGELLAREQGEKIRCLVRCTSPENGKERIRETFLRYGLDPRSLMNVEIVCGDITQPCLGLSTDVYRRLSEEVTTVLHCAAVVNMLANYDMLSFKRSFILSNQNNEAFSDLLSKGLSRLPTLETTTYRTIRLNKTRFHEFCGLAETQSDVVFKGFTSTSLERTKVMRFAEAHSGRKKNETDVILVINGKSGHQIEDFSQFGGRFLGKDNQKEVLFDKGINFRFERMQIEDGCPVFYLTEI